MLEKVKLALRIRHTQLDSEILDTIEAGRREMVRAGVSEAAVYDPSLDLISTALVTYCKAVYASDKAMAEKYQESWKYQLDCLRKSAGYRAEVIADV